MPALNFQARFAPLVESGEKTQTIRKHRKDGRDPKVGDRLVLYTGMRTKQCRKLGEGRVMSVRYFELDDEGGVHIDHEWIGWHRDPSRTERRLARADGFENFEAMLDWFEQTHGLPFEGLLIRWKLKP